MQKELDILTKEKDFRLLRDYINSTRNSQGALMQILHKAQEIFGYIPIEVQKYISIELDIPLAEIYGVSTFYSHFSIKPKGKHKIGVCLGTACYVKGSQEIIKRISEELNISIGETTEDNMFTLESTRCLGCCGLAPVMMIDDDVYGKIDPQRIPEIIAKYIK